MTDPKLVEALAKWLHSYYVDDLHDPTRAWANADEEWKDDSRHAARTLLADLRLVQLPEEPDGEISRIREPTGPAHHSDDRRGGTVTTIPVRFDIRREVPFWSGGTTPHVYLDGQEVERVVAYDILNGCVMCHCPGSKGHPRHPKRTHLDPDTCDTVCAIVLWGRVAVEVEP